MVRLAIIGAGFMGSMHAEVYSQLPNVKIAAIVDERGEKAKSLAEKYGAIPYLSADQVFAKSDITIVDICLPTFLHKEFVIKAAEAGKDIICEKPIALTIEDAKKMVDACRKKKVRFMVAHVIRFWPEYAFIKRNYDQGRYGKLITITCTRLSPRPTWGWQNWLLDNSRSGGALFDLHIHDVDFILYLLGQNPVSLYSVGTFSQEEGYTHVFTTYNFPGGITAFAEGGWDMTSNFPFEMKFIAQFEKAVVDFDSTSTPTLTVYYADGRVERPQIERKTSQVSEGNISDLGGYYFEINYFIDHVVHNKEFQIITPEDAVNSLAVVLKELESLKTGKIITF
ncbi:MAG: Gfo/Idh/MocA family oxidoreductase [Candidatus Omnitrophica bacterium]|nr:Gfo/Idh/MocA family oxidoreductase [Candidatus Omnitrophota bacterium]MCM8824902.1 Gfo/Idh/MocA family oxidoreductase [Candidatus Omnitrophota bacterium]